jgi:hypothetical protein
LVAGLFLTAALSFAAPVAWCVEPFSLDATALRAGDVPQSIASSLETEGVRVSTYVNGLNMPVCEIFWSTSAIAQPMIAQPTKISTRPATYGNLYPGSFVGVIRFLAETKEEFREDFHDQKLKPGYYTMRYAALADDDRRDFLLLSPVAVDSDPAQVITIDQLTHQSRLASRTSQPATLHLMPPEAGAKDLPSLRTDEDGACILQARLHLKSSTASAAEVVLAVTLVNPPSEEDGS